MVIKRKFTPRAVNYVVTDENGYLFTMVPAYDPEPHFEVSSLDRYLEIDVDLKLFYEISEKIVNHDM